MSILSDGTGDVSSPVPLQFPTTSSSTPDLLSVVITSASGIQAWRLQEASSRASLLQENAAAASLVKAPTEEETNTGTSKVAEDIGNAFSKELHTDMKDPKVDEPATLHVKDWIVDGEKSKAAKPSKAAATAEESSQAHAGKVAEEDQTVSTPSGAGATLLKADVQCNSGHADLGKKDNVMDCMSAVESKGGTYFVYGKGAKNKSCLKENTDTDACAEGFKDDQFDFYKVYSWRDLQALRDSELATVSQAAGHTTEKTAMDAAKNLTKHSKGVTFEKADMDDSDSISREEFNHVIRPALPTTTTTTHKLTQFEEADTDNSGSVDEKEFETIKFHHADADRSGNLSKTEFDSMLGSTTTAAPTTPLPEATMPPPEEETTSTTTTTPELQPPPRVSVLVEMTVTHVSFPLVAANTPLLNSVQLAIKEVIAATAAANNAAVKASDVTVALEGNGAGIAVDATVTPTGGTALQAENVAEALRDAPALSSDVSNKIRVIEGISATVPSFGSSIITSKVDKIEVKPEREQTSTKMIAANGVVVTAPVVGTEVGPVLSNLAPVVKTAHPIKDFEAQSQWNMRWPASNENWGGKGASQASSPAASAPAAGAEANQEENLRKQEITQAEDQVHTPGTEPPGDVSRIIAKAEYDQWKAPEGVTQPPPVVVVEAAPASAAVAEAQAAAKSAAKAAEEANAAASRATQAKETTGLTASGFTNKLAVAEAAAEGATAAAKEAAAKEVVAKAAAAGVTQAKVSEAPAVASASSAAAPASASSGAGTPATAASGVPQESADVEAKSGASLTKVATETASTGSEADSASASGSESAAKATGDVAQTGTSKVVQAIGNAFSKELKTDIKDPKADEPATLHVKDWIVQGEKAAKAGPLSAEAPAGSGSAVASPSVVAGSASDSVSASGSDSAAKDTGVAAQNALAEIGRRDKESEGRSYILMRRHREP